MTLAEFIERARRINCRVDVSGSVTFISDSTTTIKVDAKGHFYIRHVTGQDMNYKLSSPAACSRALKLPRS